jgi:hypothetical protein
MMRSVCKHRILRQPIDYIMNAAFCLRGSSLISDLIPWRNWIPPKHHMTRLTQTIFFLTQNRMAFQSSQMQQSNNSIVYKEKCHTGTWTCLYSENLWTHKPCKWCSTHFLATIVNILLGWGMWIIYHTSNGPQETQVFHHNTIICPEYQQEPLPDLPMSILRKKLDHIC